MLIKASPFEKKVYSCFQMGQQQSYICQRLPILGTYNSPGKHFSFKAIHVIPSLLLQKPIEAS